MPRYSVFAVLRRSTRLRHTSPLAWHARRRRSSSSHELHPENDRPPRQQDQAQGLRPGRHARLLRTTRRREAKTKAKLLKRLDDLQYLFYAVKKRALLIVLQGIDTGGKDGTIRHVMSGVSPQGCRVTSFKSPTPEELAHDFLWRIHAAVPEKGDFGIFNRSHYEDVLVVRVHKLVPKKVWKARYDEINAFEKLLVENRVHIVKFFLHISKDEQKKRLEARITDPQKSWKISAADFAERKYWDDYVSAYEEALSRCSTESAPWFVIPANHKWFPKSGRVKDSGGNTRELRYAASAAFAGFVETGLTVGGTKQAELNAARFFPILVPGNAPEISFARELDSPLHSSPEALR